ncbi:TetR/AcrR family transcriptional regulator [Jiangella alba]|uniref:TetR/AcrR family transcriptional regulator n=1 Tax=Jiangella alba TaxID=561176 RepID=UPI002481AC4C|nr:TetR/AcrR family transcriptional regulator [Jiangella alba]
MVRAAREVIAEKGTAGFSVRAVAARAGIGASTLRYYFPSQRDLYEAVFGAAFDATLLDLRIHDTSVPPAERLAECLAQLLPPAPPLEQAVERWLDVITATFGPGGAPEARLAWSAVSRRARSRVTAWLAALAAEGALTGDVAAVERRARLLLTVVDGLALGRLVPIERLDESQERSVLDDAVAAVLR